MFEYNIEEIIWIMVDFNVILIKSDETKIEQFSKDINEELINILL